MARTFSSGNNLVYPSNANGTAPVTTGPLTLACWGRFTATSIQNVVFTGNASDHYFGISVGYVTAGRVAAVTGDCLVMQQQKLRRASQQIHGIIVVQFLRALLAELHILMAVLAVLTLQAKTQHR